jgi:hypothetical protein
VLEESNELAGFVRRDEYSKAIDVIPNILCRLFRFMAKYSENVTEQVVDTEGIDLRSKNRDGLFVTEWVLRNEIYRRVQDDHPVSSLSARFLEDVGEVSRLLLSFGNIQLVQESRSSVNYLKYLRYLNDNLKEKISDIISRSMDLVNKFDDIVRSTDPHEQSSEADNAQQNPVRPITISQLLFQRFYHEEINSFVCPYCGSDKCTPACNEIRMILNIDRKVDAHNKKLIEVRQVLGPTIDNRIGVREAINLETELDDAPIQIVNLGACNTGFLSNMNYPFNEIKTITVKQNNSAERLTCRITRPVIAGQNTGYQFYYGAEILARERSQPLDEMPPCDWTASLEFQPGA